MKIRGVLFDKDGTLIDFDRTWQPIFMELVEQIADGNSVEARRLLPIVGFDEETDRFKAGSIVSAGNNADLVDAWHPELAAGERERRALYYDSYFSDASALASVPLTDLRRVLGHLRHMELKLGIATNDATRSAHAFAEAAGLSDLFDFVTGYDGVANPKPSGDMVTAFCTATGILANEVAVVGDNTHDLEMAMAGGAGRRVGVLSGSGSRADLAPLADIVLADIDELAEYLNELNAA